MKAVLLSIHPKYCELIANSEKTVEVRKTKPKIPTPFRCYMYCTKPKYPHEDFIFVGAGTENARAFYGGGKVIGEFVCDNIDRYTDEVVNSSSLENFCGWNDFDLNRACIHPDDIEEYAGGKDLYGWHISDLVIYSEPKELGEFFKPCKWKCFVNCPNYRGKEEDCDRPHMTKPPQSWCYVEELT